MTYETKISKGYDGWHAITQVELRETPEGMRVLEMRTSKSRKVIDSSVRVYILKKSNGFMSQSTDIFGDFYRYGISPIECKRVTEKAIKAAHESALNYMADLVNEAQVFYKEKDLEELPF